VPSWVGRKVFHITRDTMIRDSAATIDMYYGQLNKTKEELKKHYVPEVEFVTKKEAPKKETITEVTPAQMAAWVAVHVDTSNAYKKTLGRALTAAKYDSARLAALGRKKAGRNAALNALGVPHGAKKALIKAIRKFFKKQQPKATESAKAEPSQMVKDFREAKKSGAKKALAWPDMEFIHKVKAAKGGFQIEKTIIKAQQLQESTQRSGVMQQ